ncbi:MAG: branched-chain amino acid ABC transporter permease LivH [Spirochaetes bacterium]|nr:branched-chain amino acid ABC transporter permease LivH [Spirochaetota bacterium]
MDYFFGLCIGGLTRGSIYALLALGYTMVYGIIRLINFAHGEIYMIGAFTALIAATVMNQFALPAPAVFFLALTLAVLVAACYGVSVDSIAYRPLRSAPRLAPLISAIGMSLFLQNYVMLTQTANFIPFPQIVPEFPFLAPVKQIINSTQLVILAVTAAAMGVFTVLVRKTKLGRAMRATAEDRTMAMLCGVNVNRVIAFTFAVGSAIAALGGTLISAHTGQINFTIGLIAGIKAFVAAVLGGIGSIPGAVLGSFILGATESFASGYISSDYEDAFAFILLILILVIKPAGLLGRNVKEKV